MRARDSIAEQIHRCHIAHSQVKKISTWHSELPPLHAIPTSMGYRNYAKYDAGTGHIKLMYSEGSLYVVTMLEPSVGLFRSYRVYCIVEKKSCFDVMLLPTSQNSLNFVMNLTEIGLY